jgi:hypothetical protein
MGPLRASGVVTAPGFHQHGKPGVLGWGDAVGVKVTLLIGKWASVLASSRSESAGLMGYGIVALVLGYRSPTWLCSSWAR